MYDLGACEHCLGWDTAGPGTAAAKMSTASSAAENGDIDILIPL